MVLLHYALDYGGSKKYLRTIGYSWVLPNEISRKYYNARAAGRTAGFIKVFTNIPQISNTIDLSATDKTQAV